MWLGRADERSRARQNESYTYAKAGVSIAAGNALVKAIAPLAKSTARPGADASLGGFGGFFDLKAAGYRDPLLVAANDGVGTKLKLAIDQRPARRRRHRSRRDVRQRPHRAGRRAALLPRLFRDRASWRTASPSA
jgi:hypothetical protein